MLTRDEVEAILKDSGALLEGHFLLTSGRHSNAYMQCAKILQYPEYAKKLCAVLAEQFKDKKVDIVIGPAMGGIIVAYELARQMNAQALFTERENGKMVLRRGFGGLEGKNIIVAEDVITTGGSVQEVIDVVNALGGNLIGVCVLVDRSSGNAKFGVELATSYVADVVSYEADSCPLCKEGKLPAIKPGSRTSK